MPRLVYSLLFETERKPIAEIIEFVVNLTPAGNSTGGIVPVDKRRVVDLRPGAWPRRRAIGGLRTYPSTEQTPIGTACAFSSSIRFKSHGGVPNGCLLSVKVSQDSRFSVAAVAGVITKLQSQSCRRATPAFAQERGRWHLLRAADGLSVEGHAT